MVVRNTIHRENVGSNPPETACSLTQISIFEAHYEFVLICIILVCRELKCRQQLKEHFMASSPVLPCFVPHHNCWFARIESGQSGEFNSFQISNKYLYIILLFFFRFEHNLIRLA